MIKKDFNFLPPEIIRAQKNRQKVNLAILLSIFFLVAGFSLLLIPYNEMKRLEDLKAPYERKIETVIEIEEVEKMVTFEKQRLMIRQDLMHVIDQEAKPMLFWMEEIEKALPEDVAVNAMSLTANSIRVGGVAKSDIVLGNFIRNMKQLGLFEEVHVPAFNTGAAHEEHESGISFTLEGLIK